MPITRGNNNGTDNRRPFPNEVVPKCSDEELKQYIKDIENWHRSGTIDRNCKFYMFLGRMSHIVQIPNHSLSMARLFEMSIYEECAKRFAGLTKQPKKGKAG